MVEIRKATQLDAKHIALLARVTYTESHGKFILEKDDLLAFYKKYYSVASIRKELENTDAIYWIVFENELPIGFAKLALNESCPASSEIKICKLHRLYILNDFIGLQIGSRLQDIVLKTASDLKYQEIWLTVYHKNKKAVKFYERYGFEKKGQINFFVGETNYENLIFIKKLL